jgi:hypothetical protein
LSEIYRVSAVTPSVLLIEVIDVTAYLSQPPDRKLSIGSYLKISDDKGLCIVALVHGFRIRDGAIGGPEDEPQEPSFVVEAQQVGCLKDGKFRRGGQQIAIPPTIVEVASNADLVRIYDDVEVAKRFAFSRLSQNLGIRVVVDGDRFFGKHIAVVGSTGSGKSCAVAKILQEGIKPSDDQAGAGVLNNSHILLFDLHGEYGPAFPTSRVLTVDNLVLPYWLMNAEELEEMFIESQEQNSHNQISLFKRAVIRNKQLHNDGMERVTYDTPAYFSLSEVIQFISNHNVATKDAATGDLQIKSPKDGVSTEDQMFGAVEFEEKKTGKINSGPYAGEFDRFVSRLETRMRDERLSFLLDPRRANNDVYGSTDLEYILRQFTSYGSGSCANVTIVDLSGVPFDVLSVVVSLITRLVFDVCFYAKRMRTEGEQELPFLLVYEEAHNYVPRSEGARYNSVKKSIERVAKEGRKYGLSLMIVSQRPSEVSETILSQCNNFVAMRLTNPADQQYIRRLLPDSVSSVTESLPVLERQEAMVLGDSISVPSVVVVDEIQDRPNSRDVAFHTEWKKDWLDLGFGAVVRRIRRDPDLGGGVQSG